MREANLIFLTKVGFLANSRILIASCFILFILTLSGISRYWRATELRVEGYHFCNPESERLWKAISGKKVNMVPIRSLDPEIRQDRLQKIRKYFKVHGPLAFVHVSLLDNRSEFLSPLEITIKHDGENFTVEASQAVAIANAVAYVSEQLKPISMFLGLSRQNLMRQSIRYFLLGEGETGLMVYTILQKLWEWTPEDDVRPCIFLVSD